MILVIKSKKAENISTGSPGSGTNFMAEAVLSALEIPMTFFKDSRLPFTESANALRDNTIIHVQKADAMGTCSIQGLAFADIEQFCNYKFTGVSG